MDIQSRRALGLLLIYITVHCCSLVSGENFTAVINTEYGPVRGFSERLRNGKEVSKFYGIPYATAERFQQPEHPKKWTQLLEAVKPKACAQAGGVQDAEEDCLTLNIYAAASSKKNASMAVMVYIHGGGFRLGSGHSRDPSVLVMEQNIMVVTVNYRLGVLGFLCSDSKGIKANVGLLDQIEAVKWVQRNIARFGGDPRRVTIAGHSAGAVSVCLLMLSPLTADLYNNVLAMSGTVTTSSLTKSKNEGLHTARSFFDKVGCKDGEQMCLQSKTTDEILAAQSTVTSKFGPCVDGHVIPDAKILEDGKFRQTSVMVGVNNDEGSFRFLRLPGMRGVNHEQGISREVFRRVLMNTTWIDGQTRHVTDALEQAYTDWADPTNPNTTRAKLVDMFTDSWMVAPSVTELRTFAKANLKTYSYYFEQRPPSHRLKGKPLPSWVRAYHGADVVYLFGGESDTITPVNDTSKEEDKQFAKTFRSLVANFIMTSDPNTISLQKWPQFTSDKQEYLRVIKPSMSVRSNLRADKVHLWTKFLPSLTLDAISPTTEPTGTTAGPQNPPTKRDKGLVALALTSVIFIVVSIVLFILLIYTCVRMLRIARVAKGGYSAELLEKSQSANTDGNGNG